MSKSVNITFKSEKTHWESGFDAPENWDELSDNEQYNLIEQWRQEAIDSYVKCYVEVVDEN